MNPVYEWGVPLSQKKTEMRNCPVYSKTSILFRSYTKFYVTHPGHKSCLVVRDSDAHYAKAQYTLSHVAVHGYWRTLNVLVHGTFGKRNPIKIPKRKACSYWKFKSSAPVYKEAQYAGNFCGPFVTYRNRELIIIIITTAQRRILHWACFAQFPSSQARISRSFLLPSHLCLGLPSDLPRSTNSTENVQRFETTPHACVNSPWKTWKLPERMRKASATIMKNDHRSGNGFFFDNNSRRTDHMAKRSHKNCCYENYLRECHTFPVGGAVTE
jgi:hypothetical protein